MCASRGQTANLSPVVCFIFVADENNNCSIVCKVNEEVIGELWSEKEGTQYTTLRDSCV